MAEYYDKELLNEICSHINLLEYASKTLNFEKRGNDSYAAHCCLHIDKTPSLFITPSKNLFHCFSCGCSGNLLNWLMIFEKLSFNEAIEKVGKLSNTNIANLKQCDIVKFCKDAEQMFKKNEKQTCTDNRTILPDESFNAFERIIPQEWVNEGISPAVMERFNIRVDTKSNRIVYPIYNSNFNLIGFKGRTRYDNYKTLGIKKYMNYQKIGTTDFFVGMKEQFDKINTDKKIIIFEGIKSVMKAYSWGYDYSVAAETSHLNDGQIKLLIQLGIKDVTIAFDNDVSYQKIRKNVQLLNRFTNVFVVQDRIYKTKKLLQDKESPVDEGKEVFEILLSERKKIN